MFVARFRFALTERCDLFPDHSNVELVNGASISQRNLELVDNGHHLLVNSIQYVSRMRETTVIISVAICALRFGKNP